MDIIGDNRPNHLVGTPDADNIHGHGGGDVLAGRGGNDIIQGGDSPIGSTFTSAGASIGAAIGGVLGLPVAAVGAVIGAGIGRAIDVARAASNSDFLFGEEGKDTLLGQRGDDFLDGGADNDTLNGGLGDDILVGGLDNDILDGGPGNDHLFGDSGADDFVFDINSLGSLILLGPSITDTGGTGAGTLTGGTGTGTPTGGTGTGTPTGGITTIGFIFPNNDTVMDYSRADVGDRIFVDSSRPSSAQFVVDNEPPFGVLTDADRNVDAVPDGLRLDFGLGNTLTVLNVTSLTVGEDIFFV